MPERGLGFGWSRALAPGARCGRFELVREIGRGGFGVVYEARDTELGRTVAFKAVRASAAADERLLREADAAARLSHPNIVTLFDAGRTEDGPYLIFELLRGESLADRLDAGALTTGEALHVATEIARAIAYAHAHGVVHRDLTPANVFLCDDGAVKVLDFGMAHAFGRTKLEGGTPSYMAPEQRRGAPEDERTDVFALGVILYRMLTGTLPARLDSTATAGPQRAAGVDVDRASDLGRLAWRMLEHDPVDRPRDGAAVLASLEAIRRELGQAEAMRRRGVPMFERPSRAAVGTAGRSAVQARRSRRLLLTLVLLGLVLAAGAVRYVRRGVGGTRLETAAERPRPSIAVLPFTDMSPNHDQEYFADGVAEEILNALVHVDGLRVIGRTSSFSFKGKNEDLRSIGRSLNVGAVLEGSVRVSGTRVRITAQLVNVADGYELWAEEFDRELRDVFVVQDEIAKASVAALQIRLLGGGGAPSSAGGTASAEAHTYLLIGDQLMNRGTLENDRRAVDAYEKALVLDPAYALSAAHLSRALAYLWAVAGNDADVGFADVQRRAISAADQAIALGPGLAESYLARARVRSLGSDWSGAEADVGKALAIEPGSASAKDVHAGLLATFGRISDAIVVQRQVVDLDPLNASSWNNLGWFYLAAGQLDPARAALRRSLEIAPDSAYPTGNLAISYLVGGDPEAALATWKTCTEERFRLLGTAMAEHDRGHAEDADAALRTLASRFPELPYRVAEVYAWRGDHDRAFAWLERAFASRDTSLRYLKADPLLRKIRHDGRFTAVLRKLNLPVD